MNSQLERWQGEFGRAYTDRNPVDWKKLVPAFTQMLGDLPLKRLLEVGCNRGHNLVAIRQIVGDECDLVGVEPNAYARQVASASRKAQILAGNVFDLPFADGDFDLVMTAGVLIHVALPDLGNALSQVYRCSRRYVLAVEYFAEEETVMPYRGHDDLLWKRNFPRHYQEAFPDLTLVREGSVGPPDGVDESEWWLFEKRNAA